MVKTALSEDNKTKDASFRWYIIHVYSGFENKVEKMITEQSIQKGLQDDFERILVPTEDLIEVKSGKKIMTKRKFFPSYVLAKMKMTPETQRFVVNLPKVTGFLSDEKNNPLAISNTEADHILYQIREGVKRPKTTISFHVGENVRVCDGPFTSFDGIVEEVDEEKERVKVSISIFGRSTPVDLDYGQVEKNES